MNSGKINIQTKIGARTLATLVNYFWESRRQIKTKSQIISDAVEMLIEHLDNEGLVDSKAISLHEAGILLDTYGFTSKQFNQELLRETNDSKNPPVTVDDVLAQMKGS